MKRLRITIRTLFLATALVALISRGGMLWIRSVELSRIARNHDLQRFAAETTLINSEYSRSQYDVKNQYVFQPRHEALKQKLDYEKFMFQKYQFAAFHPWSTLDPDPPMPPDPPDLLPIRQ